MLFHFVAETVGISLYSLTETDVFLLYSITTVQAGGAGTVTVERSTVTRTVHHGTTQIDGEKMRLTVTEAANLYQMSRTTLYRKINSGKLSAGTDGKIDLSEMIRVFGEAENSGAKVVSQESATSVAELQSENERVLQEKIKGLEQQVKTLQSQLESANNLIEWFKGQVEKPQKLIEHKAKKSLFGRVLSAITSE